MSDLEGLSKAKLMVECAKRKIKGFQGKDAETLRKMIQEHDAALAGEVPKKKKTKKAKPAPEPEPEEEEELEEEVEEEAEEDDLEDDLEEEEAEEEEEIEEEEEEADEDDDDLEEVEEEVEEEEEEEVEEKPKPKKKGAKVAAEKKVSAKDKVKAKKAAPAKKAVKAKAEGKGRKAIDRKALMEDHGSPYRKNSSSDVFFRLIKKGGTKEAIVKRATEYFEKKSIKCDNPSSRFDRIVAALQRGETGTKYKVEKSEKGKYTMA